MPEGPSIVILKEEVQPFIGKKIIKVEGNSKLDIQRLAGQKIVDFKSWGKHFLICFKNFTVRIHFMLFGSYRINEQKDAAPRLRLIFEKGEINFYACSVKFIEENLDEVYDWKADVMNDSWDPKAARQKFLATWEKLIRIQHWFFSTERPPLLAETQRLQQVRSIARQIRMFILIYLLLNN